MLESRTRTGKPVLGWLGESQVSSISLPSLHSADRDPPCFHPPKWRKGLPIWIVLVSQKVMTQPQFIWKSHGACERKAILYMYVYHKTHVMAFAYFQGATCRTVVRSWMPPIHASPHCPNSLPRRTALLQPHAQFVRSNGARGRHMRGQTEVHTEEGPGNEIIWSEMPRSSH